MRPIAVIGATGQTGSRVVKALTDRGAPVRPLSRSRGGADLRDPVSLRRALDGAGAVYVVTPSQRPDEADLMAAAATAAAEAGVERIVLHSVLHPHTTSMPHHLRKADGEQAVRRCGVPWTILQPGMYMQTVSRVFFARADGDEIPVPWNPASPISAVHLGDVAEVAATVLLEAGHENASYELAGPDAVGVGSMIEQMAAFHGRPLRARQIDPAGLGLSGNHQDEVGLRGLTAMCAEYDAHGFAGNPRVLGCLLGRSPTTFAEALRADAT